MYTTRHCIDMETATKRITWVLGSCSFNNLGAGQLGPTRHTECPDDHLSSTCASLSKSCSDISIYLSIAHVSGGVGVGGCRWVWVGVGGWVKGWVGGWVVVVGGGGGLGGWVGGVGCVKVRDVSSTVVKLQLLAPFAVARAQSVCCQLELIQGLEHRPVLI